MFNSILASTIWRESHATRLVWITLLAMANKRGEVEASVPGLADMAKVTRLECVQALDILMAPDPDSRSQEFEGRGVAPMEGGWLILNYAKYRTRVVADERREYNRVKQQESRQRKATK